MVIHKIRHKLSKFHKMRKVKEENLPPWKEKWHKFNETKLGWLEKIVDKLIPWLVLLLLAIIIGEFADTINFFDWHWMETFGEFIHHYEHQVHLVDQTIIGFFVVDLYFNFFKKATIMKFLKTSILDIIAVAPLGLIFRFGGLSEAQSILHVTEDIGKEASRMAKEGEAAAKLIRLEQETAKLARIQKVTKSITRLPRMLRLYRLSALFGKKKVVKKKTVKKSSKKKKVIRKKKR